jgi:Malate/L-lactate dehydrogenases
VNVEKITTVFEEIFTKYGFSLEDSKLITKILIDADLRGITSHGVQRLTLYDKKLQSKYVLPRNKWKILKQTKTSLLIDANQTMGQLVSNFTMEQLIEKS